MRDVNREFEYEDKDYAYETYMKFIKYFDSICLQIEAYTENRDDYNLHIKKYYCANSDKQVTVSYIESKTPKIKNEVGFRSW